MSVVQLPDGTIVSRPDGLAPDVSTYLEALTFSARQDADRAEAAAQGVGTGAAEAAADARDDAEAARDATVAARDTTLAARTETLTARTEAVTARNDAVTARTAAQTARDVAVTNATNASASATNAATSATNASNSATASANSASAAATSANNAANSATSAAASAADAANRVAKTGDTMTGALTLPGNPIDNLHAAPRQYVDAQRDTRVSKSGDTMTGALVLPGDPTIPLHAAPRQYVDAQRDTRVSKNGDTMTGALTLSGNASSDLHAIPRQQALLRDGSQSMTGALLLAGNATQPLQAVPRQQVILRDGSQAMTAALAMGDFNITGLAAPAADNHAARRRDLGVEYLRSTPPITGNPTWIEMPLDAGYDVYEFFVLSLAPTSNDLQLIGQLSTDGGASWIAGTNDYTTTYTGFFAGASNVSGFSLSAGILSFQTQVAVVLNGRIQLNIPSGGGRTHFISDMAGGATSGFNNGQFHVGVGVIGRANRVRFAFNGGVFANQGRIIQRGTRP